MDNSERGNSFRCSPPSSEVLEQDFPLIIIAINEDRRDNREGQGSISSDEGVHSLGSDNSETDPKTIQEQKDTDQISTPDNIPKTTSSPETEPDAPSFAYINPVYLSDENQPDSIHVQHEVQSSFRYVSHPSSTSDNNRPEISDSPIQNNKKADTSESTLRIQKTQLHNVKKITFGLVLLVGILASTITIVVVIVNSDDEEQPIGCTVTPERETKCKIPKGHVDAVMLNASKYITEGNGEIIIPLSNSTNTTVNNIHFYMQDDYLVYSTPNASACYEKGTFPVVLRDANKTVVQTLPSINVDIQGPDAPIHITPLVYRNLTDGHNYALLMCFTVHCDTVVTNANLLVPGYSRIQKPMSCTYKETDNGLNTCSITIPYDVFENAQYIQCASVSSVTEPSVTIHSADAKYKDQISSLAVLYHGQDSQILRKVTVNNGDVVLEKESSNLLFTTTGNTTDSRIALFVKRTESGEVCEVGIQLSPATCNDADGFVIRSGAGVFRIATQIKDGPNLIHFPNTSVVSVGERLVLNGVYCIEDGSQTVTVNMLGKLENDRLMEGNRVELGNPDEYVILDLKLNVMEPTYVKRDIACQDHNKTINISVKNANGFHLLNILSRIFVNANYYRLSSTGGSFQEHAQNEVVRFEASVGCRSTMISMKLKINGVNGSSYVDDAQGEIQVTNETGVTLVTKEYHFDVVTLQDNGTVLNLTVSFFDDEDDFRLLSKEVTVFVVPGGFCKDKQPGCNFQHPYRRDQYVACGQDVIAAIHSCPEEGQIFRAPDCRGFCT